MSNNNSNMDQIFHKLGDLKHFFVYGQKLVPIIQKIIDFMRDTVPILENVNNSIQYSTSKIPKAALQINSVTNATEIATGEILDTVDSMFVDIVEMKKDVNELREKFGNNDSGAVSSEEMLAKMDKLENSINKIESAATSITISLQVQDITAQQLASVNHLIQSIQQKLSSLLIDFGNEEDLDLSEDEREASRNATFNPDARYDKSGQNQKLADSIIDTAKLHTSQDEIDKLFAK